MVTSGDPGDYLFREDTPLGFSVRTTEDYWRLISEIKHPAIADQLEGVQEALRRPVQVRRR